MWIEVVFVYLKEIMTHLSVKLVGYIFIASHVWRTVIFGGTSFMDVLILLLCNGVTRLPLSYKNRNDINL